MPQAASGAFTIALRGFFGCSPPDTGCWGDDNRKQLCVRGERDDAHIADDGGAC